MERSSSRKKSKWDSPVFITIITAIIGIIGTGFGAMLQGYRATNLEQQKFESSLILKALEQDDAKERAKYLKFLIDAGLVKNLDTKKIEELAETPARIPRGVLF